MIVEDLFLDSKAKIANDYIKKSKEISPFFDYTVDEKDVFVQRQRDLANKSYQRNDLASVLRDYNHSFLYHDGAIDQIEKLADPKSLVVVAGQQAGLLTGPLYTIYKIITVLQLAKEQEQTLGVPVVPVFWIAGEDHDFEEINHVFMSENQQMTKHVVGQKQNGKIPTSHMSLDIEHVHEWVLEVMKSFGETIHTKEVLHHLRQLLSRSDSYVQFFGELIHWLFKDTGIVLMDAAYEPLRKLEAPIFQDMVQSNEQLQQCFNRQASALKEKGYGQPISSSSTNAHLFYLHNGERELLTKLDSDHFTTKSGNLVLSTDDLLDIAETTPERLSNNVVTRPLMQEKLLPVLAFVAGPGEIGYWATLKDMFHFFGEKVPPILPRLSATLVEPHINKLLVEKHLDVYTVLTEGVKETKDRWYTAQKQWDVSHVANQVKRDIDHLHEQLRLLAKEVDPSLEALAQKNYDFIESQITFLEQKVESRSREKYKFELDKFERIKTSLLPTDVPQERVWNIVYYLNRYGADFVSQLNELDFSVDSPHKLVYL